MVVGMFAGCRHWKSRAVCLGLCLALGAQSWPATMWQNLPGCGFQRLVVLLFDLAEKGERCSELPDMSFGKVGTP